MKIVVTGGTGFIGRPLCRSLTASGHEVVVLTRASRQGPGAAARDVVWQPPAPGDWERELDGAAVVINLAGESVVAKRWTPEHTQRIESSRLEATTALVGAMRKANRKPRLLISASAVGYYGPRGDEDIREDASAGRDLLAEICRRWEAAAQAASALGVRVVCLRIGVVLAPDGGALARMLPPFRWGVGGPLGSGRQWVSWIYRKDLIDLVRWAITEPRALGVFNATAPNPVTMREFAQTLARLLHRPACLPVPAPVLRLLLGEMADMLLRGQRAFPEAATRLGFVFRYPTVEAALASCLVSPHKRA